MLKRWAFAAFCVAAVNCTRPVDLPLGYVIQHGDVAEARPLSRAAMIVADNQQHYLYGRPLWVRTALVDKAVHTAIRAPQLDLFGPSVLTWVMKNHTEKIPVIHLGDGLNLSCVHEFDRFVATMDQARRGWFMAPGNHDGIYFGSSDSKSEWKDACDGGGGPIAQSTFIERYLTEVLAGRRAPGRAAAPKPTDAGTAQFSKQFVKSKKGSWTYVGSERAWLTRVAWRIEHEKPYHSYIVQELTVTASVQANQEVVKYILLDTSNYEHAPTLIPIPPHVNPGSTGDLRADQLGIVEGWLDEYRASKTPHTVVLMGHHPFEDLTPRARMKLDELRRTKGVLLYVSAHTHRGSYIPHQDDDSGWLELNVGSTVDWPLEFRSFQLLVAPSETGGLFYSNSALFTLGRDWTGEDAPECAPSWQPQRGDPDYYIDYKKHLLNADATAGFIFDSLLQSYKRMLRSIPSEAQNTIWPAGSGATGDAAVNASIDAALAVGSDAGGLRQKRALLLELETFDDHRRVPDKLRTEPTAPEKDGSVVHRDYRLCQAIWASKDDETGARRARPEDWYIAYPKRKAP